MLSVAVLHRLHRLKTFCEGIIFAHLNGMQIKLKIPPMQMKAFPVGVIFAYFIETHIK